jgi:hypothetical protein
MIWGQKEKILEARLFLMEESIDFLKQGYSALIMYHNMVGGTISCGVGFLLSLSTPGVRLAQTSCSPATCADCCCELKPNEVES